MTSIGPNPYAQYGSAYARAAATPSLAATLSRDGSAGDASAFSTSNAATTSPVGRRPRTTCKIATAGFRDGDERCAHGTLDLSSTRSRA